MTHDAGMLVGSDGRSRAWYAWQPRNARAALVLVHGLGEHAGRYAEFAERLVGAGIATFAADLRGHGRSHGQRGHIQSFDVFLRDLDLLRRETESRAAGIPLFLLGHSLGGLIALRYLEEYSGNFRGAIICSPWLATVMPVPSWKVGFARVLSRLLPRLRFRAGIDPAHVSRDPRIVEAYRTDPLVHDRVTPRFFTEVSTAMDRALARSGQVREPLLFMVAGADRLVASGHSLRAARAMTVPDTTVRVYPDHYHELLNEIDRATIHREIADWISARL